MKQKISVTVDEDMIESLDEILNEENGAFRNRSHVVEYSLRKFIKNKKGDTE